MPLISPLMPVPLSLWNSAGEIPPVAERRVILGYLSSCRVEGFPVDESRIHAFIYGRNFDIYRTSIYTAQRSVSGVAAELATWRLLFCCR